jgi:hypothetical protein
VKTVQHRALKRASTFDYAANGEMNRQKKEVL